MTTSTLFNQYLNCHFRNCHEIAGTYSESYKRVVRIFYIPGYYDVVGISDGVDSWIANATASVCGINVRRILDSIFKTNIIPRSRHIPIQ